MPPSLARVAAMLIMGGTLKPARFEKEYSVAKGTGRVYIHRLRKFLGENYDIKLHVARSDGYYLTGDDRDELVRRVRGWVSEQIHG